MSFIIAGIHTGIGKTICSAVICQALNYDYWKPVQAGDLNNTDSHFIQKNVSNTNCRVHPEVHRLKLAASPHYAAAMQSVKIKRADFFLPATPNKIIVETAGGIMSPLAADFLNIDLMQHLNLPVILVSNNYLGSINHTLLTVAALRQRNISIKGLVFSGTNVMSSCDFILSSTKLPLLFSIPLFKSINKDSIAAFARKISINI